MKSPSRRALIAGVAGSAVAAGVGLALWQTRSGNGASDALPAADEQALWSLRLERPAGGELVLAQLRGRPLIVNFWATWCAPCVKEMPELDRFHRTHAPRGWQVLGIAVDRVEPVKEFLGRIPVGFPIVIAGLPGMAVLRQLGNPSGALPFTVQFDADGRVRRRKLGETHAAELERWAAD